MKIWCWCLLLFSSKVLLAQTEAELKVDLRQLGHEVLLASGDSVSRVLPIERAFNRYHIRLEQEFSFDPSWRVQLSNRIFNQRNSNCHFILEVVTCDAQEVVYSFESKANASEELMPCMGRMQPKGCYSIQVTFMNLGTQQNESLTELSNSGPNKTKSPKKLMILLLIGGVFLVIVLGFWLRKQPKNVVKPASDLIQIGTYQFHPSSGKLRHEQSKTDLTGKEAKLLGLLAGKINQTIDRDIILKEVWADEKGDYIGRTLDVYISKLRKKLANDTAVAILNERGVGYSLVVDSSVQKS